MNFNIWGIGNPNVGEDELKQSDKTARGVTSRLNLPELKFGFNIRFSNGCNTRSHSGASRESLTMMCEF